MVTDAAGDTGLAVVEIIHAVLGVTPATAHLHPGEVVNFFVTGGTAPYGWAAEAGSLSNIEGDRVGYVAPDDPGSYSITVADGRDVQGRASVVVTAPVLGMDGQVVTDRGIIKSGIVVDGVPRHELRILLDQGAHVELSFPLDIPDDGQSYDTYGAVIYTPPQGAPVLLFRTSDFMNPLVVYEQGPFPVYAPSEPGSSIVVDFYRGLLTGIPGRLDFYVGYAPQGQDIGSALLFNASPYTLEIR